MRSRRPQCSRQLAQGQKEFQMTARLVTARKNRRDRSESQVGSLAESLAKSVAERQETTDGKRARAATRAATNRRHDLAGRAVVEAAAGATETDSDAGETTRKQTTTRIVGKSIVAAGTGRVIGPRSDAGRGLHRLTNLEGPNAAAGTAETAMTVTGDPNATAHVGAIKTETEKTGGIETVSAKETTAAVGKLVRQVKSLILRLARGQIKTRIRLNGKRGIENGSPRRRNAWLALRRLPAQSGHGTSRQMRAERGGRRTARTPGTGTRRFLHTVDGNGGEFGSYYCTMNT